MSTYVYARVSTEDQAERQTVDVQLETCRAHCERQGWAVDEEFLDEGVSGTVPFDERPAGAKLLEVVGKGDHVVVYCVDRLSRDMATGVTAYNRLVRLTNGHVEFVMNSFDDSPEGRFQFGIFMGVADFERGVIKRRTMTGIATRVRKGEMYRASVPPYGYRYDPETRQLVVREDQAAVVRRIYEMYLSGKGARAIITELTANHVPVPSEGTSRKNLHGWHPSRIGHILQSSVYRGIGLYRAGDPNKRRSEDGERDVIEMPCPVIVDEATWDLVQKRRSERAVLWSGGDTKKRAYLLSKMVYCGACEARMSPSGGRGQHYYRCTRRALYPNAREVVKLHEGKRWSWPMGTVDAVVKSFVRAFMSDPERLAPYLDARIVQRQATVEASHGDVVKLERQLADLDASIEGYTRLADKDMMVDLLDKAAKEKRRVEKDLKAAQRTSHTVEDTRAALVDLRAELWELTAQARTAREAGEPYSVEWEEPKTEEEWRQLVRHLIDKVHVTGSGKTLSVRFEGVLHQSLDLPTGVKQAPRPQSRGSFYSGWSYSEEVTAEEAERST